MHFLVAFEYERNRKLKRRIDTNNNKLEIIYTSGESLLGARQKKRKKE